MGRLDTGPFEQLPNKFAALHTVIIEGFVGPFTGDQDPAPSDAEGAVALAEGKTRSTLETL
jgi:hypothetical protein